MLLHLIIAAVGDYPHRGVTAQLQSCSRDSRDVELRLLKLLDGSAAGNFSRLHFVEELSAALPGFAEAMAWPGD